MRIISYLVILLSGSLVLAVNNITDIENEDIEWKDQDTSRVSINANECYQN